MANLSNINNILRTGSLGVGINRDPLGAFEISSATKPGIKMFNTAASGKTYEAYSDANGNYIIYDQDADDNRLVINSAGNATFAGSVTITGGTTNGLNITTSGTQDTININRAANNDNAITKYQTASVDKWIVGLRNTGDDNFRFYSYGTSTDVLTINQGNGSATFAGMITVNGGGIDIDNNDDVRLRFDNAGTFLAGLQVATTAGDMISSTAINDFAVRSQANLIFSSGGNTERMRIGQTHGDKTFISSYSGGTFPLRVGHGTFASFTPTFVINDSGDVGIGTDSPASKLHVEGAGEQWVSVYTTDITGAGGLNGIRTQSTGATGRQNTLFRNTANNLVTLRAGTDDGAINFIAGGSAAERMRILANGNVGIGETSPEVKLDVQGSLLLNQWGYASGNLQEQGIFFRRGFTASNKYNSSILTYDHNGTGNTPEGISINGYDGVSICTGSNTRNERMRITSTGALSFGTTGTAYGAAGEVLTSNGNAAPSWQAAGGGGSAWPQEKFAVYTITSTTSNILIATMNSTTWHGDQFGGCLKFTINDTNYIQVSYVTIYTYLSQTNKWFFKGNTEMTTHNTGTNPVRYVFAFAGNNGSYGTTCTLKINRVSSGPSNPVNVLVQAISSPDMFILN